MINVDYRQLMQQIQKIEGELRQETDKTKALKVQLEEDVNKRSHLQLGLKEHTEEIIALRQREINLNKELTELKDSKRKVDEEVMRLTRYASLSLNKLLRELICNCHSQLALDQWMNYN